MKFEYYSRLKAPFRLFATGWRWRLRAGNGKIIASGEGYVRKRDCLHAVDLVNGKNNFPVVEVDS